MYILGSHEIPNDGVVYASAGDVRNQMSQLHVLSSEDLNGNVVVYRKGL